MKNDLMNMNVDDLIKVMGDMEWDVVDNDNESLRINLDDSYLCFTENDETLLISNETESYESTKNDSNYLQQMFSFINSASNCYA